MHPAETNGRLTIDLAAIAANYRLLAARAAPAECAAVVKADAYGLGAERVGKALWAAGARTFFVAITSEARALRAALPQAVIYVLNGLAPGAAASLAEIGARPVLGSLDEIEEWSAFVAANSLRGEAALHIDTGMNRLGLPPEQAADVAQFNHFRPSLVMSHLARADDPADAANARQLALFKGISALFPDLPASLANSAATLTGGGFRFDLCRPGIALYGGNPFADAPNPMQPVVRLDVPIAQIRTVQAGAKVGYGEAETMRRPSRLAILSVGYADGMVRAAGSSDERPGAAAMIAGHRCPLVGRISMDMMTADITKLPEGATKRGDLATLIGDNVTLDDFARAAGTISYEVLTRLGPRFTRAYTG